MLKYVPKTEVPNTTILGVIPRPTRIVTLSAFVPTKDRFNQRTANFRRENFELVIFKRLLVSAKAVKQKCR